METKTPPFISKAKKRRATGARAAGLAYEKKAQQMLMEKYASYYVQGPWFSFFRDGCRQLQYCQPDGLMIDFHNGTINVVEIKLRHTSDAWWQVRHLYIPVVSKLFGERDWVYGAQEVCKWFDPDEPFPEDYVMLTQPAVSPIGKFGVHIWKS